MKLSGKLSTRNTPIVGMFMSITGRINLITGSGTTIGIPGLFLNGSGPQQAQLIATQTQQQIIVKVCGWVIMINILFPQQMLIFSRYITDLHKYLVVFMGIKQAKTQVGTVNLLQHM